MPVPAQRDPEEARIAIRNWLATKLPATRDLDVGQLGGPAATGFSNETLIFDATWTDAGSPQQQGFVVRVEPTGYTIFLESAFEDQYNVMRTLSEKTDVPIPEMFWLERDPAILGAPFFVMGKIDGQVPPDSPAYHVSGWVTEIEPEQRAQMWWSGLEAMVKIHQVDWRGLGLDFLDKAARGPAGLDQQLAYYEEYFDWAAAGKPHPLATRALEWLRVNRPDDELLALCWGDARIGNMIFADFNCAAVLDWEMVTLGNPEQDLGWWLFLDRYLSEGQGGAARLAGFPSHDDTVARYEELTGRPVRNLHYYKVFAGFRFSIVMLRIAEMVIQYELMPPDTDMGVNNDVTRLLATLL